MTNELHAICSSSQERNSCLEKLLLLPSTSCALGYCVILCSQMVGFKSKFITSNSELVNRNDATTELNERENFEMVFLSADKTI